MAAPRDADPAGFLFLGLVVAFMAWLVFVVQRNQRVARARMDEVMRISRENAQNSREALDLARRNVELGELRLNAQEETNRLLQELTDASRRPRP